MQRKKLRNRRFRPYWFETAIPSFLIDVLTERGEWLPKLENTEANEALLSASMSATLPSKR